MAPPDPILGISVAFNADKDPKKVNLGVGAYRDDNGKPYVFNVVRKAEEGILADKSLNKEYQGIDGHLKFIEATQRLVFRDHPVLKEGKVKPFFVPLQRLWGVVAPDLLETGCLCSNSFRNWCPQAGLRVYRRPHSRYSPHFGPNLVQPQLHH
jgi:Aminotransferase class I and II